jgi:DNA-binding response OmpR family regulator
MPPRLLLVEDDPTSRAFLAAASEALPAVCDQADRIAAALDIAGRQPHDLWMIVANLPDGSGTELLSALRARGLHVPAIAHTAARERGELDALLAAGFDAAVSKPLPADAWREALRMALAGGTAQHPVASSDAGDLAASPLWDDDAALAAMNGHRAHVDALRQLFRVELPATRQAIGNAFAAGDHGALRAGLHRLRASCGFTGASRLDAAARMLHAAPASDAALAAFLDVLQDTLSS